MQMTLMEVAGKLELSPDTTELVLARAAVQCNEDGCYQIEPEMIADIKEMLLFARIAARGRR